MTVWLSVCVAEVWTGASFWEIQGMQPKQRAILRPVLPALLPTQPPLLSQAAVAQGPGQAGRVLFREQREVLAPGHSHPMNYFNARLDLQAWSKVIIGLN